MLVFNKNVFAYTISTNIPMIRTIIIFFLLFSKYGVNTNKLTSGYIVKNMDRFEDVYPKTLDMTPCHTREKSKVIIDNNIILNLSFSK